MPLLADAINLPFVFVFGLAVLVPLLAFQVLVESAIVQRIWKQPFRSLAQFFLAANILSLLAGIPTRLLNSSLYSALLPPDLPGYFARYPAAIAIGSLIYFVVTILVEGLYAVRRKEAFPVPASAIWSGILLANLATYLVLAPLHYFATRPFHHVQEFTSTARWSTNAHTQLVFVDSATGYLKTVQVDGSNEQVIVSASVRDFLVSPDLKFALYRGSDNHLYFYQGDTRKTYPVWQTKERFQMEQAAFSPTGRFVAFASEDEKFVEVLDLATGRRIRQPVQDPISPLKTPVVAWSTDESQFYLAGSTNKIMTALILAEQERLDLNILSDSRNLNLLPSFGRVGDAGWWGGGDWGHSFSDDECGNLTAWSWSGLDSGLRISREQGGKTERIFYLLVNPGLLHLAKFQFEDVAFLPGCRECIFDVNGFIYLLDIHAKRVGTIAPGRRFILLTDRYQKRF